MGARVNLCRLLSSCLHRRPRQFETENYFRKLRNIAFGLESESHPTCFSNRKLHNRIMCARGGMPERCCSTCVSRATPGGTTSSSPLIAPFQSRQALVWWPDRRPALYALNVFARWSRVGSPGVAACLHFISLPRRCGISLELETKRVAVWYSSKHLATALLCYGCVGACYVTVRRGLEIPSGLQLQLASGFFSLTSLFRNGRFSLGVLLYVIF